MRRALVTGATGGLGIALARSLLEAGYAVKATGRQHAALERLVDMGADTVSADLLDTDLAALCADRDVVFHVAGLSSPWRPDQAFDLANVEATRRLLAAAQAAGVGCLVFVSSPSVYARWRDQTGVTEATPWPDRPLNAYARTKGEAEKIVLAADRPGFRTVAIRPRALIGPDDTVLLPRILRLVRKGRFPLFRRGEALVELTDVRDGARALMLADQHREAAGGQAINISGGRPLPIAVLVKRLGERLDIPVRIVPLPLWLGQVLSVVSDAVCRILPGRPEPILTPYTLSTLAWSQAFDLAKARSMLDYEPKHDAVETALAIAPDMAPDRASR